MSYHEVVEGSWIEVRGSIIDKLTALREETEEWNKNVFGNVFAKKRKFLARIEGIHKILENQFSNSLIKLEHKL